MNIAYPYLPEGRTIKYVDPDNEWMKAAKEFSRENSTDRQMPTGSVIVKDGVVIGRGANQVPLKNPFFAKIHKNYFCVRRILHIPTGQKYWMCPGCSASKHHSEGQAVRDARANGHDVKGADLYLWGHWWACKPCWDAAIGAGIRDLYVLNESHILFNRDMPGNVVGKQFD
ncbi:MAG: deaminase [Minisyncoccia bacterium]